MERLRRLEQLHVENPVFFVTFCTEARHAILASHNIHEAFLEFCRRALERGVFVGRYVLMPDHIHLFVKVPPPSGQLSDWIRSLKNSLSKVLRGESIPAPHWQKGFFDHVIRSHESYDAKSVYVRENPVRAGLVRKAEEWPYAGELFNLTL